MNARRSLIRTIIANDLRLFWRAGSANKARWVSTGLGRAFLLVLMIGLAWFVLTPFAGKKEPGGATFACMFLTLLTLMSAAHRSLEVLYHRGDLQLLLASPVPEGVVLATRMVDVGVTTLLSTAGMVLPLVIVATWILDGRWAFGALAWIGATLLYTPLALMATMFVVRRFGAARARVGLQVASLLLGLSAMVLMQLPSWMARSAGQPRDGQVAGKLRGGFADALQVPPFTQLADAAFGDPQSLGLLFALAVCALLLAWLLVAREFTISAQSAASDLGLPAANAQVTTQAWKTAFVGSRLRQLVRKDLRLVRRDPLLIAHCAMRVATLLPMLVGAFAVHSLVGIVAFSIVAAAMFSLMLAALMTTKDDGREFVAASPLPPQRAARSRALAAAMPGLSIGWICALGVLVSSHLVLALMAAVGSSVMALSMGWLGACTTPLFTAEEMARNKQPSMGWQMMLGLLLCSIAAGGAGAYFSGAVVVGLILFPIAIVLASLLFLVRPRPSWHVPS